LVCWQSPGSKGTRKPDRNIDTRYKSNYCHCSTRDPATQARLWIEGRCYRSHKDRHALSGPYFVTDSAKNDRPARPCCKFVNRNNGR
jgi:hypothetical protein